MKLALKHKGNPPYWGGARHRSSQAREAIWSCLVLNQVAERIGLCEALGYDEQGKLALWQVMARIIDQGSRLSAVRMSESHAVDEILGLESITKDQLYRNLIWLSQNQESIEKQNTINHLEIQVC